MMMRLAFAFLSVAVTFATPDEACSAADGTCQAPVLPEDTADMKVSMLQRKADHKAVHQHDQKVQTNVSYQGNSRNETTFQKEIRTVADCGGTYGGHGDFGPDLCPGLCLSVKDNIFSNGQKMQLESCHKWSRQLFDWIDMGDLGSMIRVSGHGSFCVVTDGDRTSVGTALELWDCNEAGSSKYWKADSWTVISMKESGKVPGIVEAEHTGAPVVLVNPSWDALWGLSKPGTW
eukprot:TRINITY_DN26057_c0_g1_i1.p1 TRINITY_DN26057_c0_g1~~TRINITY_DN26057_c0_g1_i1.p1  ORF type:complete len:233 (-),score=47.34 TRINITY_DN26057_c0_g1_i1:180-878(-)